MDKYEIIDKISEYIDLTSCRGVFNHCMGCPLLDLVDISDDTCGKIINKLLKEVI